jgi:hypothetical protein
LQLADFRGALAKNATVVHANRERNSPPNICRFRRHDGPNAPQNSFLPFMSIYTTVVLLTVPLWPLYLSTSRPSPSNGAAGHLCRHLSKKMNSRHGALWFPGTSIFTI